MSSKVYGNGENIFTISNIYRPSENILMDFIDLNRLPYIINAETNMKQPPGLLSI